MADLPADAAAHAYDGTSFDPEKRGESLRRGYAERITSFAEYLDEVAEQATDEQKEAELDRYRENMRAAYLRYIGAHSRCVSSYIVGGSNFPVRRAERANQAEHNAYGAILELDEKARKSVVKRYGAPDPNAPIRSSDPDAIERLNAKLDTCRKVQERMREANKVIRAVKDKDACVAKLQELGFTEAKARELLTPDFMGRIGFASFELSNNNAEIHRLQKRISEIEAMRERAQDDDGCGEGEGGIRYEVDGDAARVKLYFPDKPDEGTRAKLKASGFRWSPRNKAWQAYIKPYTIRMAKEVAGVAE